MDKVFIEGFIVMSKSLFCHLHTKTARFAFLGIIEMGKRITDTIITGNEPGIRLCIYYSPFFDLNIWRRGSSLTGERTKKDPSFEGFRQSSNRLKHASPIASSLYKLLPAAIKQFTLYRTLTGEAIRMLKEAMEASVIWSVLKEKYIDPLLQLPIRKSGNRTVRKPATTERINAMADFSSYPQSPSGVRKITRRRRAVLYQRVIEGQSAAGEAQSKTEEGNSTVEYIQSPGPYRLSQKSPVSISPLNESEQLQKSKPRTRSTHGLIYLGRLAECKTLKLWLRPLDT